MGSKKGLRGERGKRLSTGNGGKILGEEKGEDFKGKGLREERGGRSLGGKGRRTEGGKRP